MAIQYVKLETRTNDLLTNYLKTMARSNCSSLFRRYIGEGFNHEIKVSKKGVVTIFAPIEELQKLDQIVLEKLDKGMLMDKVQVKEMKEVLKIIDDFVLSFSKIDYSNLNNAQLKKIFDQYCQSFYDHATIVYIVFRLDELLKIHIQKLNDFIYERTNNIKKANDWTGILSLPRYKSYTALEEEDFLKILVDTDDINDILKRRLKNHSKKYLWKPIQQDEDPYDYDFYLNLVKEKLKQKEELKNKLSELINYLPELRRNQKEIMLELKMSQNIKKIVRDLQNVGHMRDIRKATYCKSRYYSRFLFDEIGKRISLDRKSIGYLTPNEIQVCLLGKKKPNLNTVRIRKDYYIQELMGKKIKILTGAETLNKEKLIMQSVNSKVINKRIVKGMGACPGKVRGRVRQIKDISKTSSFQPNEILVTIMTTPEVVPAMKKAAAIVTDEGGLTCHAAIVSRELNVPCVVGTKFATKIFKNGDFIEVDAAKGIVKKLNKS